MSYRGLSAEELRQQYDPRIAVIDHESWKYQWVIASAAARARLAGRDDIPYGTTAGQTLDVFPGPRPGAPINIFIHGGFWRFLDKRDHTLVAEAVVAADGTAVLINYDLCPTVPLAEVIRQCRAAVAWVYAHATELGGDRDRITVSGHSAGGHLTAMVAAEGWGAAFGLPPGAVKGATMASGVFEMDPLLLVPGGEELKMTPATLASLSPQANLPDVAIPLVIGVGGCEPPEWHRQAQTYAASARARGSRVEVIVPELDNHYSILLSLANPTTPLCGAMLAQMGLG